MGLEDRNAAATSEVPGTVKAASSAVAGADVNDGIPRDVDSVLEANDGVLGPVKGEEGKSAKSAVTGSGVNGNIPQLLVGTIQ